MVVNLLTFLYTILSMVVAYWAGERYSYPSEDLVKAAYWWNEGAQQGNMKAFNNLGLAYLNG